MIVGENVETCGSNNFAIKLWPLWRLAVHQHNRKESNRNV